MNCRGQLSVSQSVSNPRREIMNVIPTNHRSRQNLLRGVAAVASVSVACAVLASVTGLFASAASMPWLPATPDNLAAMQPCEKAQGTAAKRVCAETVVARVLSRDSATRLAQNAQEARAGLPAQ